MDPAADPSRGPEAAATPGLARRRAVPLIAGLAIALAVFLLCRVLRGYSIEDIAAAVAVIPARRVALATLFAAGSYAALTLFDALALRYVRRALSYRKIVLASFVSLSIGHSIGFAALSSGALRYRFYSGWGVRAGDVARIIVFCGVTVGLGLITLAGVALLVQPGLAERATGVGAVMVRGMATICFLLVATYLFAACCTVREIRLWRWRLPMPPQRLAFGQVLVGTLNFTLVAAVLYEVLAASGEVDFFTVAATYVIANVAALVTHVPGGWGVLEAVVVLLLPNVDPVGALVVYRVVYYLVPFTVGGTTLGLVELWRHRRRR